MSVHFSSGKDDWETPDDLFATYNHLFNFTLDAAGNERNHKCSTWFGPGGVAEDALSADWGSYIRRGNIWLNPPYSRGLQMAFVAKAAACQDISAFKVVCLLPARTDTKLFHELIQPLGNITFLKGRVKFVGAAHGAPFPSMIVVF